MERLSQNFDLLCFLMIVLIKTLNHIVVGLGLGNQVCVDCLKVALFHLHRVKQLEADG